MNTRATPQPGNRDAEGISDWFLRDSHWNDTLWIFAPTSRLDEDRPVRIRWDVALPNGQRLTAPRYAALLESARQHIALIRSHSLHARPGRRAASVRTYFQCLCALIRWMTEAGFSRFAALDTAAIREFTAAVARRKGLTGAALARTTLEQYVQMLIYLYQHRRAIDDSLQFSPFPGERANRVAAGFTQRPSSWPYTPDGVAVPLIQGAIEFLQTSAIDILRAREVYIEATTQAQARHVSVTGTSTAAAVALSKLTINTPQGRSHIDSVSHFVQLVENLYIACFVVIAYLVGPRLSEILHLQVGCVRLLANDGSPQHSGVALLAGSIFKQEAYHGRPHEWIAPAPAVHAIFVLEALSAPHRQRTRRKELWLRPRNNFGAGEWQVGYAKPLRVPSTLQMTARLNRFAASLRLPLHDKAVWHLTTHQGRNYVASQATSSSAGPCVDPWRIPGPAGRRTSLPSYIV